jgi:hypothetical protein
MRPLGLSIALGLLACVFALCSSHADDVDIQYADEYKFHHSPP